MTRNTLQKQIVLESLQSLNTHPGVEELYADIATKHPTISKATVYRNLHRLAEEGQVVQIAVPGDVFRYDGCTSLHYHFRCNSCGNIYDLDIEGIDGIEETVANRYGYQVDRHEIVFTGRCLACNE